VSALDARIEGSQLEEMIGGRGVGGRQQHSQLRHLQQVALDLEDQLFELSDIVHASKISKPTNRALFKTEHSTSGAIAIAVARQRVHLSRRSPGR